jgi:3-hydroxyisobutyrate dehydrogenase
LRESAEDQDVGLALTAAHTYDLPTPLTWAAKSVYEAVCQEDGGEMATKDFRSVSDIESEIGADFSVVFEWLRRKQAQGVERGWKDGGPGV